MTWLPRPGTARRIAAARLEVAQSAARTHLATAELALEQLDAATRRLGQVVDLHGSTYETPSGRLCCVECGQDSPCPTQLLARGEQGTSARGRLHVVHDQDPPTTAPETAS